MNDTVALITTPAAVTSSAASTPARVSGTFTCMFGASAEKRIACSAMRAASR